MASILNSASTPIIMSRNLLLLFVTIFLGFTASSQDGKLISRVEYVFADTTLAKMRKAFPDAGDVASNVSFSRITYLSDGLKVKGYIAVPKKPGKYPCIIFNRGGNRDFG